MVGNLVVGIILVVILGGAVTKIVIDRKNGVRCSGCPNAKNCDKI